MYEVVVAGEEPDPTTSMDTMNMGIDLINNRSMNSGHPLMPTQGTHHSSQDIMKIGRALTMAVFTGEALEEEIVLIDCIYVKNGLKIERLHS